MRDSFLVLALWHLGLVAASSGTAAILGIGAGILVTRPAGASLRRPAERLGALGQAFPPVAVLAVAVPVLGFGLRPAFLALLLYGLLPILQNTIAGLAGVPVPVREAAAGLGMTGWARLRHVELPLAWPFIRAGLRTSVTINMGTAAIAATVGVRTLGLPIIIGIDGGNTALLVEGASLVALLAIVTDWVLGKIY